MCSSRRSAPTLDSYDDPVTATNFFACLFRLDGHAHYVLWYTNDADGLR